METLAKSKTASIESFITGQSFANYFPFPMSNSEYKEVYTTTIEPIMTGLLEEYAPITTTKRMLIELAAHSYTDWVFWTNRSRELINNGNLLPESRNKQGKHYASLQEASYKRAVDCLELLSRHDLKNVKITITEAGNINFGQQAVIKETKEDDQNK